MFAYKKCLSPQRKENLPWLDLFQRVLPLMFLIVVNVFLIMAFLYTTSAFVPLSSRME